MSDVKTRLVIELKDYFNKRKKTNIKPDPEPIEEICFHAPYKRPIQSNRPQFFTNHSENVEILIINNEKHHINRNLDDTTLKEILEIDFNVTRKFSNGKTLRKEFEKLSLLQNAIPIVILLGVDLIIPNLTSPIYDNETDPVCISDIINFFHPENAPNLSLKPKLILIQSSKAVYSEKPVFILPNDGYDTFIVFSTLPGFITPNDVNRGHWYIYHLCHVISTQNSCNFVNYEHLINLLNIEYNFSYNKLYSLSSFATDKNCREVKVWTSEETVAVLERSTNSHILRTPVMQRKNISITPSFQRKMNNIVMPKSTL